MVPGPENMLLIIFAIQLILIHYAFQKVDVGLYQQLYQVGRIEVVVELFVVVDVRPSLHPRDYQPFAGLVRFLNQLGEAEPADCFDHIAKNRVVIQVLLIGDLPLLLLFQIFDKQQLDSGLGLVE